MKLISVNVALFFVVVNAKVYHEPAFIEDVQKYSSARIVQGLPAKNSQFPWQAFLIIETASGYLACGGSLISPSWILTAAHCVSTGVRATVALGEVEVANSTIVYASTNLHSHANYDSNNLNNDLGLIGLPVPVKETENIKVIQIAKDPAVTYAEEIATASGFGQTSNSINLSQLNYVQLRVITNANCASFYGDAIIIPSTICTLGIDNPGQGTCSGDSGGPLMAMVNGVPTLIGVTSFVSGAGCESAAPKGFVRPSHFLSWFNEIMNA